MKKLSGKQLEDFMSIISHLQPAPNGTELPEIAAILGVDRITYGKTDEGHANFVVLTMNGEDMGADDYWTIDLMEEVSDWNTELSRIVTDVGKNRITHTKWTRVSTLSDMLGYDGLDDEHGVFVKRLQNGDMVIQIKHYDEVYDFNMLTFLSEYTY